MALIILEKPDREEKPPRSANGKDWDDDAAEGAGSDGQDAKCNWVGNGDHPAEPGGDSITVGAAGLPGANGRAGGDGGIFSWEGNRFTTQAQIVGAGGDGQDGGDGGNGGRGGRGGHGGKSCQAGANSHGSAPGGAGAKGGMPGRGGDGGRGGNGASIWLLWHEEPVVPPVQGQLNLEPGIPAVGGIPGQVGSGGKGGFRGKNESNGTGPSGPAGDAWDDALQGKGEDGAMGNAGVFASEPA